VPAAPAAQADEPAYTRNRVREFLRGHSCYELIPESGKVVLLDMGLPIRQAFHALHEQARAPAPGPPRPLPAAQSPRGPAAKPRAHARVRAPAPAPRRRAAPARARRSKILP
jgi:hypothetical protein